MIFILFFLTLLNFSPCKCGISSLSAWKPEFMLCILLLSFELAICLRSFLSAGGLSSGSSEADGEPSPLWKERAKK